MLHIFQYDNENGKVQLDKGNILLIKEFADLMVNKRNICNEDNTGEKHLKAFREFTYIWLAIDWESFYKDYSNQERHKEALKDSKLTEEEWNDPIFRTACRKYKEIQESNRSIRILHASQKVVDKFIDYFNDINPQERDEITGKPVWKVKDIQTELQNLPKVLDELKAVESQVKKEMEEQSQLRGGAVEGFTPIGF